MFYSENLIQSFIITGCVYGVCMLQESSMELVLSFYFLGSGKWTQVARLDQR